MTLAISGLLRLEWMTIKNVLIGSEEFGTGRPQLAFVVLCNYGKSIVCSDYVSMGLS